MTYSNAERVSFSVAGSAALRILIASYFLSVALGLIPGTAVSLLFAAVLPPPYADATAAGLVFVLAFMIMISMYIRVAALCLSIMTIYASYLTMVELGITQEFGTFWRDAALVAALMLTYSHDNGSARRSRKLVARKITPRRVVTKLRKPEANEQAVMGHALRRHDATLPTRIKSAQLSRKSDAVPVNRPRSVAAPKTRNEAVVDNIFVFDDYEAA